MYTVEEFDKQKSKVMNYIMYKKRTNREVLNKFTNVMPTELLEDIIVYLQEAGYLNDTEYIDRAVKKFICLKNLSIKEINYKLMAKGIEKNQLKDYFIDHREKLEEYELQSAKKIRNKKAATYTEDEIQEYLRKKGYQEETIKQVIEEE